LEHYHVPTYAAERYELMQIILNGYQIMHKFKIKSSSAAQWDFLLDINTDKSLAEKDFYNMIENLNMAQYEISDGVYYEGLYYAESRGQVTFAWMQDEYFFMLVISPQLWQQIQENDAEALNGSLFELKKVELGNTPPTKAAAILPEQGIKTAKEHAKKNNTAFWYDLDLDELTHYYVPAYANKQCELTHITFYGGSDGLIYFQYDYAATQKADLLFEMERESACGEEYLETMIRRYDLQPYENCEGVYYAKNYATYFFWLHEGHAFMLSVLPEFMEYLKANDSDALKGPLFELEKVELK